MSPPSRLELFHGLLNGELDVIVSVLSVPAFAHEHVEALVTDS